MGVTVKGEVVGGPARAPAACGYAADLDVVAVTPAPASPVVGVQDTSACWSPEPRQRPWALSWVGCTSRRPGTRCCARTILRWVADDDAALSRGAALGGGRGEGISRAHGVGAIAVFSDVAAACHRWPTHGALGQKLVGRAGCGGAVQYFCHNRRRRPWGDRLQWQPRTCRGDKPC